MKLALPEIKEFPATPVSKNVLDIFYKRF